MHPYASFLRALVQPSAYLSCIPSCGTYRYSDVSTGGVCRDCLAGTHNATAAATVCTDCGASPQQHGLPSNKMALITSECGSPQHGVPSQQDGPDHLGIRCNALPEHRMALISSGLCALQRPAGSRPRPGRRPALTASLGTTSRPPAHTPARCASCIILHRPVCISLMQTYTTLCILMHISYAFFLKLRVLLRISYYASLLVHPCTSFLCILLMHPCASVLCILVQPSAYILCILMHPCASLCILLVHPYAYLLCILLMHPYASVLCILVHPCAYLLCIPSCASGLPRLRHGPPVCRPPVRTNESRAQRDPSNMPR